MKRQVRAVMLAAAALASVVSTQAATYPSGDLIIGFTSGTGNDFEFDLGAASSLSSGSFNLNSQLSGFNLSTVNWGVVGSATVGGTTRTSWVTVGQGLSAQTIPSSAAWSKVNTAVSAIYTLFPTAGPASSATPNSTDPNSWFQQTRVGSGTGAYHNVYVDPNSTGLTTADFYSVVANGLPGTLLGSFTLNNSGMLTFTAVPEPSTYGVLAGMGLLALCLRRQLTKATV